MEKRTPHVGLATVRLLIETGRVRMTFSAVRGAQELGMETGEVLNVIRALRPSDFRKSMTTYADHRIWQDVYCPKTRIGRVYLKLTVLDELLVVSFKEA